MHLENNEENGIEVDIESNIEEAINENKSEISEIEEMKAEDEKYISEKSFVADINTLKMPLFLYTNYKPEYDAAGEIKPIEEKRYTWIDSKNRKRELYVYCKGRLPRQFESDTLHGLLGLFVKKHAPFPYNKETGTYTINENSLEFTWYELCAFMNIPSTGYYIDRLKDAIRIMKQTQYFSYAEGSLYDKSNAEYIQSGEEGLSLITKYKFKTTKKATTNEYSNTITSNYVVFDELILNNLRHEYFKYLDVDLYFKEIPSGIERGIYGYLESNRYDSKNKSLKYIKRTYEVLKIGIPLEYNYISEMKRKIKKPLNHLKEINYLKDWAFGDEIKINGESEHCIYFSFTMTMNEIKEMLERKREKMEQLKLDFTYDINNENEENNAPYLKIPRKSLVEELVDRKVDRAFAEDIVRKKEKWDIITYILWVDKQTYLNSEIKGTGALLSFALRREFKMELSEGYQDIINFVEKEKKRADKNFENEQLEFKQKYKEYLIKEVEEFKKTAEYNPIKELLLSFQNSRIDELIKMGEKNHTNVSKYKEFKVKQDESEYFNEMLTKEIKMIKNLKSEKEYIAWLTNKSK